jgi:hypothetical protein
MATLFIDYENGNDNWGGSSFAPLASGTNGRITSYTFSSATANFPNDGSLAPVKNLFGVSESLEEVNAWNGNNITYNRSTISPPSGLFTPWDIKETTAINTHTFVSTITIIQFTIGTTYTISLYAKANGRNQVTLQFGDETRSARFDLSNGTVAQTAANATAAISSVGDNWYRISITATATATGVQMILGLTNDAHNATSAQTYAGNTELGIYISSPQIEANSSVTSYEKPPDQRLTIWNGSSYLAYRIVQYINSTSLLINLIQGGASIGNQSVNRQYFIGGRWKTISTTGATAARLFPGDTIRIMASPTPTIVGSGLWSTLTGRPGAATSNIGTATNTSPIRVTCASTMAALGISNGSTVLITGNTANTNSNGMWEVTAVSGSSCDLVGSSGNFNQVSSNGLLRNMTHRVVTLNSAVTENIASYENRGNGRTAWVASTNVTTTLSTNDVTTGDSKEGDSSDSIAIGASFTTGKAAYKATGSLNLSGYQQLSFYIKQTAGTVAASGDISLRLCSDTTGDTTVHTFNIPPLLNVNIWIPFTINLGSAMSSSIQSVALYIDTDRGAQTFLLSNIIACKESSSEDSLNLQSLISKNVGDECWYPIMSINGRRIVIGGAANLNTNPSSTANTGGYYGITENVTTYKRETIKTVMVNSAATVVQEIQEAGTAAAPFNYEFGWDRTNMSTRNSQTYFDGLNGLGYGLVINIKNYVNINNLGFVRYDRGVRFINCSYGNHGFLENIACTSTGSDNFAQIFNTYQIIKGCCNGGFGFSNDFGSANNIFEKIITIGNLSNGLYISRGFSNNKINNILSATNSFGIFFDSSSNNIITSGLLVQNAADGMRSYASQNDSYINITTSGNANNYGFFLFSGDTYLKNCIINESLECGVYSGNSRIYSTNQDNINNNHYIFTDNGLIFPQTAVRYSNTGYAWSMSPTNSTIRTSSYPLDLSIAKVAVNANSLVTIKGWFRRTSTLISAGLRVKGGQIAGVPNDITSYMSAAADTWQQVTLTFTPTEIGVVEIIAECFHPFAVGAVQTVYVDDISITQV